LNHELQINFMIKNSRLSIQISAEVAELVDARDLPQNHIGLGVPSTQCGAVVKSNLMKCIMFMFY